MKEIKFRAWHQTFGMMIYGISVDKKGWNDGLLKTMWGVGHEFVMQYIGLKDKNGKEIYKGDLIKVVDAEYPDGIVAKIDFCDDPQHMAWVAEVPYGYGARELEFWWPTCEVIGNVHENPELLIREVRG